MCAPSPRFSMAVPVRCSPPRPRMSAAIAMAPAAFKGNSTATDTRIALDADERRIGLRRLHRRRREHRMAGICNARFIAPPFPSAREADPKSTTPARAGEASAPAQVVGEKGRPGRLEKAGRNWRGRYALNDGSRTPERRPPAGVGLRGGIESSMQLDERVAVLTFADELRRLPGCACKGPWASAC